MSVQRKMVKCIAKGKKIFIGLEDSKRTWVLCARADKSVIHETSMPARYEALRAYLKNGFEDCEIHVAYEAGFRGYNLRDALAADGYGCTVVPPHRVEQEKCAKVKTDRSDARLLRRTSKAGTARPAASLTRSGASTGRRSAIWARQNGISSG
jgi:transposase